LALGKGIKKAEVMLEQPMARAEARHMRLLILIVVCVGSGLLVEAAA
jgi:hypothetical protein